MMLDTCYTSLLLLFFLLLLLLKRVWLLPDKSLNITKKQTKENDILVYIYFVAKIKMNLGDFKTFKAAFGY